MKSIFKKQRVRLSKSARKNMPKFERVTTEPLVRAAQPDDEEGILVLARMIHKEIGMFELNEDKVRGVIRPLLHKHFGIVGVVGKKDNLEAMILLRISSNWYSDTPYLEEISVFVRPEYRNASISRVYKLIDFAKKTADGLNLPLLIGVLSNQRTNAKIELYEKHFGSPAGAFFIYGATTGQPEIQEAAGGRS
jgi:GNAT superfamily N-acetyltransferase